MTRSTCSSTPCWCNSARSVDGPQHSDDGVGGGLRSAFGRDALHYISLGSKELFHSNFLGWFAGSFPDLAAVTLGDLIGAGDPGNGEVSSSGAR